MIEDYTLLVKAIQHIIRKGKSSNLCVLKDSGLFVDIKNNDFNGRDFILRLDNRGKFIYSGDMKNLIKNTSNIVNMYLEGRRNIGEEISHQLRTLLSELENKIMQLEDFSINSWSLEITRNFIRLYNEDTTVSKTQNNAEYTEICKNEAESWISQIKNLLFISRNNNRNNFEDDKLFWNTYLSNLSGLETFFNSKVVLYLESQLRNINELILLSSLQVLKKLEKHYQICNAFIDFYFGINMENIYAFKDIKEFSDSCINLIKYILKEISKYPRIVKSHISRLMNNYYKYILNVLRSNSLLENKRVIKNILVFVIENYDEMQCLINDNIGLDNGNEIVLKDNKCQFLYCVKILEELECVVDAKIILKNFRKYCDDESLINEIDKNVLIVEKHIMNRWESFEKKDDQIFENMCLENITNLFKYLSSCRNKLNVKELYENLKDKIKQKIIDNDIGTCTERIDDIIEINEVLIEKKNSCIELSLIVQYFFVFQRFKTFNEKTILIRLKILQNIDIYLLKVNEILEKNNFNLYKDFLQIINLLKYIEVTKHHFFHGNYENVVMLEKVNLKIQDIYTDLENRFNFELEKNYNFIKKMDIFEKKILFVLDNSMKVYDLTKVYEICECFNTVELFLKSNNVDLMEIIRIIYHKYSGIITSEMNKSNRILDSTNSFMQKLTNSYFYKILKGEVKTILESKIKYNVFKNQLEIFNNIINELNEDVDIFCKFIDGVFETYKKVFNLKFKYLMINNYEIDLEERMTEFQKAYFDFVLLTCKIKQNDQINFFKDSGSINFSFDSSSYVKKIKNVEFTFVSRAIDRSFKYILKQYLQNIISLLKKGDKDFFTVKCTIKTNNPPELAGIFKIFEKIFPSKNSKFFFENVIGKIQIDDEIASLITCIIEKVVSIHKNCTNELEVLYSPVCNDNLIKLYENTMKKIEVIRKIKFNEFLFFDFAYDECKNMVDLQPILQNIKREVCLRLRKVNKKIRLECGDLNLFDNFSSLLEYLKDKDVVEKVKVQGKILKIYKYLLIKFNQIKRLKEILEENNIYTDDKNYIILDKYYKKMSFLFKSTREQLKCKDKLSDKNEYKKLKDEILNELTVIENCLVEIKDIEDEQDLVKRLDEIERKIFDIIEISKYLNYILQVIRKDVIEVKIMSLFVNIKKRVDEHKRIRNNWVRFIDTPLNSLDINQVRIFLESLERFTPVLPLEKLLIKKINSSKELCLSLHTIYHPYVTEEFLDRNMKLGDCISNFTVDSLRKIVFLSENDFKIKLGLESIMNALSMLFYIYNDYIINFDEIENRLYDILADANILQSFNKNEKYIDKLSNISCNIYELINLNREIKDIQDGLNNFNNIFIGEVFEKEKVLYDRIRKEYVDFVCKNLIVNEGLKEDLISIEIQFRDKKISLANIYKNKDVIRHLKENIVSMNGIIKKTINHYRESIVRLFFVSDSDIINLLSGRAQYNDILKQVYNIDDVIIEEESIIGIRSCEEKLYFEAPISLKLSIIDFFVYFDKSLRDELIKYAYAKLKKKYKDILEQNKDVKLDILSGIDSASFSSNSKNTMCSVIDEILNELYYFNDLPYDRSIKIEFIKEYRKQNGDDFLVFYPKPTLNDNKILVNDISNKVYDFEYYPPTDIIFTRLTSIIFSSIALGLNKSSGIILFGNSGTGKTETVKYYCKSVGKQVIVFCCSDDCDLKSLENIIIGCKRLGAYLCLDEFNRLNEGTMSSITEVIYKNKESVKFFLTMNLGYTGRNQLPKTLSSIFSEVRVDTPDLKDILHIYFKNYSSKLMLLLNRLSENCESHRHYNFGLRAIKTILRNIKIYTEGDNPNLEEDITLNSIYNYYYSSLSNCDKEKLNLIFSEIFKVSINLNLSYEDMLQFGLQNSRGVLLYGYSQSGKSYLLKNCLTSEYSNIFYFNPYNVEYFFGTYDPISGDWIDSEFTEALRINKNEKVVFVFDTIMDSKWIENLNSVLDDTSSLCLKSGEVIKLSNSVKFIFEADNIDKLTPATLTRLTTIFIERNNVSCKKLDIFYQDEPVEELGIIQTKQRSFYTGKIKEILGTHRILFIKGECGKKSLVKNSIVETKIIFLNACEMKNRFLRNFLDEKEIIMLKNVKVCISNVIFYIDQFEFADDNLVESVREFIEYGKIGDVIIKQMKIICAYDLNIEHKRLESKGYVIMIDQDKEIDVYMRHELKQGGVFDSDISKIVGILCMLNEKSIIRYKDIKKIIQIFIKAYKLYINSKDLLYYIINIFSLNDSRHIIEEFYAENINILCFNYESTFFVDKYSSKFCLAGIIRFLLYIDQSFILEGSSLSGKKNLLNQCLENYQNEINIVNFYEKKEIDKTSVFLVRDHKKLSKTILKNSVILNINRPELICINIEKFRKYIVSNKLTFNLDKIKEVTEFVTFENCNEDRINNEISCDCCTYGLKKYSLSLESQFNISNDVFLNFYWNNKSDKKSFKELEIFVKYDFLYKNKTRDVSYLVFDNFYKFIDFFRTYIEISKEIDKEYEERKRFIEDGHDRIFQFKKLAASLLKDSLKKRQELENLSSTLKIKLDKIVEIQIIMKVDKEHISTKKSELDEINASNMKNKDIINRKLDSIKPLLRDSKNKISQISKNHLAEMKTMIKPPEVIKFVVEIVYVMLEDKSTEGMTWNNLIQYVRKDDFIGKVMNFTSIKNISKLKNILTHKRNESQKANNASKACGILYDWVVANYEYSMVLMEVEPLNKEIQGLENKIHEITNLINIEESKIKDLENSIGEKKKEYAKLSERLEITKKEVEEIDKKQEEINDTLRKIMDEVHNWRLEEKKDTIYDMIQSNRWFFVYKKNLFVCKNQSITQQIIESGMKLEDFIFTSTKNKNFYQVLQNIYKYNTNIIIKDVDEFNIEIYKLLKFQLTNRQFMIVLVSNFDVNHYREITYNLEIENSFKIEEDVNIKEYEEDLLRSIVYFKDMRNIISVKEKLDDIRETNRMLLKKREYYFELNNIYQELNKQYKELLNVQLSFNIFKEYLSSELWLEEKEQSNGIGNDRLVLSNIEKERILNHFFIGSSYLNIEDEVCKYKYDITIITEAEEIIYSLENKIEIYESISAGSDENNKRIYEILSEDSQRVYLIKNIHLLKKTIKTGTCRCIYTTERNTNNPLMEDTRIIFYEMIFDYDKLKKIYLNIFKDQEEEIDFHCNFLKKLKDLKLDKKYEIRFKNLSLFIRSKEYCNERYLKEIIYFNKIDDDDIKELM